MAGKSFIFRFAEVEVREKEFSIVKAGEVLAVEPKAFRVLLVLLRSQGKLIGKEELLNAVWGDAAVTDNSLARSIALLRRLLGDEARSPRFIETVSTVGYRFICPVEVAEDLDDVRTLDDASDEANGLAAGSAPARPQTAQKIRFRRLWIWPLGTAMVLVLAWYLRPALPPPEVIGTKQLTHDKGPKSQQYVLLPLLSDGSRIYFSETPSTLWDLYQVSTEGGDAVPVRPPIPSGWLLGISPTQAELLIAEGGGPLWTVAVPGGQPHRIGNLTAYDATWSPDGSKLYFCLKGSIYSAAPDGSDAHKLLTFDKGDPEWMRFSPDGRVLRFTLAAGSDNFITSIWEAQADGSHLHQLLPGFTNPASDCCGSWTPDGKYFVFQATQDGTPALWAMREGGELWHKVSHAPVRLTQGVMGAYLPLPGKDGKLYFVGTIPRGELTRYYPKTRSLSPFLGVISAGTLTFSKDGKHLVFVSYPDGVLWYGNSDGSGLRQLTFPPLQAEGPRLSPDGSQIAFTANMPGKTEQTYIIPVGGGDPGAITSGNQESNDPTWSPSGDALLYGPSLNDAANGPTALHIVNLKTRVVTAVPGSNGLFSPRWSPDGRYLLALTPIPYRLKLYDMSLHTWQDLTGEIGVSYPEWTPDSKCVVFGFSKGTAKWEGRVCLADRKIQPIADMDANGKLVNDIGSYGWTGLAPDGSILALRDIGTQEIYALDVKWP